ncbi:MAG: 50S ribosomal protein L11 methyltransferase [Rhodospirillales bacterium]|nr:50S ribosomal protein L11 methyltransferase [Rhodospirillales bacterium]
MNTRALRCVSVTVTPSNEEAISELLVRVFNSATAVYTDLEAGISRAQVYVTVSSSELASKKREVKAGLRNIAAAGLDTAHAAIHSKRLKPQDWSESWKRHFKPLLIGDQLLIKPSWSKRRPRAGAQVIILDPGLSFGTGQHPTTRFCLEQLAKRRLTGVRQSFLDIGTGTGILAIAADKLGYHPVEGFDFDHAAIRIAQENAKLNKSDKIRLTRKDLTRLSQTSTKKFDVICANLTHDLLVDEVARILSRLKQGGTLILAGILKEQFAAVEKAFGREAMQRKARRHEGEWTSGVFQI